MHDPEAFLTEVAKQELRVLLIGRRALVALGAPLLTADYDFWAHSDEIEALNALAADYDLFPNRTPEEARRRGRYVLENDERVDVMVARKVSLGEGVVSFDQLWSDRRRVSVGNDHVAVLPSIEGLILTKRIASRPKDLEDIRFLELLLEAKQGSPT